MYILYVLTNGAPWPSGWLPEVAVHQTWPRGQPRNRRLKDPDDVGAVLDPFPYIARIIFASNRRGRVADTCRARSRILTFLSSRLAPRPFFCKTRGGAGRSSDETRYETKYIKTDGSDQTNTLKRKKRKKREKEKQRNERENRVKGEVEEKGGRKMVNQKKGKSGKAL